MTVVPVPSVSISASTSVSVSASVAASVSASVSIVEGSQAEKALLPPPTPLAGFAPEEFRARRRALRQLCPEGILVVRGATEDEVVKPATYQQNSNFFYLTGVETPGAYLVLLPEGLSASVGLRGVPSHVRELLFLPARNAQTETWDGPRLGPGEETERLTGIEKVVEVRSFAAALTSWLRWHPTVATFTPFGEHAQTTREYALMQHITHLAPATRFLDIALPIARLREVKSEAEVARIAQAIAVTAEGHRAAEALIAQGAGRYEYEVEAAIYAEFRRRGAGLAFSIIVGGGHNATVLHYVSNDHVLKTGDFVVVDIGAQVDHYCGDLTRTYLVGTPGNTSATPSPRHQEIYALVESAMQHTISEFQPGTDSLKTLDDRCKAFLSRSPLRANQIGAESKEQTMNAFMPHGLSHHLGLDVHDVIAMVDREAPLLPGNVITVEPGLYIPSEGIGVRLENDYLVTTEGLKKL